MSDSGERYLCNIGIGLKNYLGCITSDINYIIKYIFVHLSYSLVVLESFNIYAQCFKTVLLRKSIARNRFGNNNTIFTKHKFIIAKIIAHNQQRHELWLQLTHISNFFL